MDDSKEAKYFCPSCGENVEMYIVEREGGRDTHCIFCGMIVESAPVAKFKIADTTLVADDSSMIRKMLGDMLIDAELTRKVSGCSNGPEFITAFTKKAVSKDPYSLVIMDVNMPVLNGINAAIAFRSIEKALQLKPVPLLFFTARKCDENFKKILAYCKPAQYVNKGINFSSLEVLASRITQVVSHLLTESQK